MDSEERMAMHIRNHPRFADLQDGEEFTLPHTEQPDVVFRKMTQKEREWFHTRSSVIRVSDGRVMALPPSARVTRRVYP